MAKVITETHEYREKINRSEFICRLYRVEDAQSTRESLAAHQREFADATHNCFAYVLGEAASVQYYSDAGEPAGTAGKPILNALLRAGLTNVLAVVTRYYGGIKLGVRGLIEAYGGVCQRAAETAETEEYVELGGLRISCRYSAVDAIQRYLKSMGGSIGESVYGEQVSLGLIYPLAGETALFAFLDGLRQQKELDYEKEN